MGTRFSARPDRSWGPPSLLYNGYRVFPGGKERPRRDADPSPPSSAVVKKEQSYTSTPPMGRTACTEPQCLYKGALFSTRETFKHEITSLRNKASGCSRRENRSFCRKERCILQVGAFPTVTSLTSLPSGIAMLCNRMYIHAR